ncbi:MAG: M3 family metallopeptidase [Longimicrobiales bacterium]|nr:M3 family metallopeptidase [Longimicrobiales bacterium]
MNASHHTFPSDGSASDTGRTPATSEANPLLERGFRIPFDRIRAADVEPAAARLIEDGLHALETIASETRPPSWETLIAPLEEVVLRVSEGLRPAEHLVATAESPELRAAWNAVLPEVTAFWSRLELHQGVWARVKAYAASGEAQNLDPVRRRHLDKTVRSFRRAGADLDPDEREALERLKVEIARLEQRFSEHVLDETSAFRHVVRDAEELRGIPEAARARYRKAARAVDLEGEVWLISLDYPSVEAVLKHAESRGLRRTIHEAWTTRCRGGEFDNRALMARILDLRHQLARALGYDGFPDYILEERMAGTGAAAREFERELAARTRPFWEADVAALRAHAGTLGLDTLRPWDVAFVTEDLRRTRYALDDEVLRPYFPLEEVMGGLFDFVREVFGFSIRAAPNDAVWHPDVLYYDIFDEAGVHRGSFYTDWFPRPEKRQGAWMNEFITGGPTPDGGFDPHLGVICGNFTPAGDDTPALLTHREVQTIFHEFGHLLHHCTSDVPVRSRAGIRVTWDFVELPSQIMENWTREWSALQLFARHWKTGEPLPEELFDRMQRARRFMGGWAQMRQISFGSVDLDLHTEFAPRAAGAEPDEIMDFIEERIAPFAFSAEFARAQNFTAFTHLFSGGYASGYYSYLWAEVLEADAFTRFRDAGVFDTSVGHAYVQTILSRGDSAAPEELFREFMGRDPDPEALIERNLGPPPA